MGEAETAAAAAAAAAPVAPARAIFDAAAHVSDSVAAAIAVDAGDGCIAVVVVQRQGVINRQ